MATPVNLDNAQFKEFVHFALDASSKKSIMKIGLPGKDGEPRQIVAKSGDWIGNIGRWKANRDMNDDVRKLFQDTVLGMFGVRSVKDLPPSVQAAMKLEDYGKGKPLTARRVIAVQMAIAEAQDPVVPVVTPQRAATLVNNAVSYVKDSCETVKRTRGDLPNGANSVNLTDSQRKQAASLLMKHGAGLSETGLRILANYVVTAIACGKYTDTNISNITASMTSLLKNVRSFKAGNVRFASFDAKLTDYFQDFLKDKLAPEEAKQYDANALHKSFMKDAPRSFHTIDGKSYPFKTGTDEMIEDFKRKVTNPLHRKALTSFMQQDTSFVYVHLLFRIPQPPTTKYPKLDFNSVEGFNMLLTINSLGRNIFKEPRNSHFEPDGAEYFLEIGANGTSAKLLVRNVGDFRFRVSNSEEWREVSMCKYAYDTEFEFDLSKPDSVTLTHVRFGQTLDVGGPQSDTITLPLARLRQTLGVAGPQPNRSN